MNKRNPAGEILRDFLYYPRKEVENALYLAC